MAAKRPSPFTQVELILLPNLRSCLLNLPSALASVLLNANTVAQNVVVELTFRQQPQQPVDPKQKSAHPQKSVFLGWTGLQSRARLTPIVGRDGIANTGRHGGKAEQDVPTVEMDAAYARLLGLAEGMKVKRPPNSVQRVELEV